MGPGDGSIIVTFDEDFADSRVYPAGCHAGVVRLRVWPTIPLYGTGTQKS